MLSETVLERPALIDALTRASPALTAIVAPPGYAKTTTALQVVRRLGRDTAWLSLESADASPPRFWTYVAAAFASAGVSVERVYDLLAADGVEAAMQELRAAVEASGRNLVLVLDDLHTISHPAVEVQLSAWLLNPVRNLQIICTSRSDLPLPVGRLRTQSLLTEARAVDLALDEAEAAAILSSAFGVDDLSAEHLQLLGKRTEGWPVGIYLAGLALRDGTDVDAELRRFAGDTRHLTEYLAAEAMDGATDDVRAFALATSVVTVLDPDLCDALTGQAGSLRLLRMLVAENLFTSPLNASATLFQYHPLFREHLQSALAEAHPELVPELHERAARWFEARGEVDEAINHAIAAGAVEYAERLIVGTLVRFSEAGYLDTVASWVNSLGDPEGLQVETVLMMSWTMLNLQRYDELERWLDAAEMAGESAEERAVVALQVPSIRAHWARHRGDVGEMLAHSEDAYAAVGAYPSETEVADLFRRSDAGLGAAISVSGAAAFWAGDLDTAVERLSEGVLAAQKNNIVLEVIFCYGCLALAEVERGEFHAALAHADQALSVVGLPNEHHLRPIESYVARSMCHLEAGRPADAASDLSRARQLSTERTERLVAVLIELQEARIQHRQGDLQAARTSLRSAKALESDLPDSRLEARMRRVEAEIRFVPREAEDLPIGARELTDREQSVLLLLPHGLKRKELAEQLHVSENTVKTHLTSIRHKLGLQGRESIVDRARELGLLPSDG